MRLTVTLERDSSDWQLDMRNPPQDRYKKQKKTKLKTWRGDDVTSEKFKKKKNIGTQNESSLTAEVRGVEKCHVCAVRVIVRMWFVSAERL